MENEQERKVVEALVEFVERVAKGKTTSETEVKILPEVVNALANFIRL